MTDDITREEAIANLNMISVAFVEPVTEEQRKLIDDTFDKAIKALEREQQKYTRPRHCDCCGVLLTEENNKCGYELCDECNERLEQEFGKGQE